MWAGSRCPQTRPDPYPRAMVGRRVRVISMLLKAAATGKWTTRVLLDPTDPTYVDTCSPKLSVFILRRSGRRALSIFGLTLLFSLSFAQMANAANTVTVIAPAGTAGYSDGVVYNGSLWIKVGNSILQYTGTGSVTSVYTIPTTVGGVSVGTLGSKRIEVDKATGILYFGSSISPMKIWSLDLNNLNNGPTLLFSGVSGCGSYMGGIAKAGTSLYFSCPDAYTLSNNKLYRFTIPSTGSAAVGDSALTTVATGTVLKSFFDVEYRSQDGYIFAVNGEASSNEVTTLVKLNTASAVPITPVTIYTATSVSSFGESLALILILKETSST